jgi:hypothetical protein
MKRKDSSPYKKFAALSAAAKEAVYRKVDDPDVALAAGPMTPAMKRLWNKAKGKGGRPRIGCGAARVLISVERGLLDDADACARSQRISRSQFFSEGARLMLSKRAG